MRRVRRLSLAGVALLLWMPFAARAQNDSGTLEVLVEAESVGGGSGTSTTTFETRTVKLEKVDIGLGQSFTNSGQRIGTGSGTVITPTVTESELVTEPSVYPQNFRHVTKDAQGRIWATAEEPSFELYVFSDSTWIRVLLPHGWAWDLDRDAQGRIWVIASSDNVYRISGTTLTEYSGFGGLGVGVLDTFAAGGGDTVWMGGYSVVPGESNPALFLRFDGREWRRFSGGDGLPDFSWINPMAVDSTGTVWGYLHYDQPDHLHWAEDGFYPSLVSYDGREWRGYGFEFQGLVSGHEVGMLVDPGGTLWVSTPYLLTHKTASRWMSYEYILLRGRTMGRSMAAERAGRIWIQGDGPWIGVFESGQFYGTPIGSNGDVFASPVFQAPQKLYYDGEVLWIASQRLARWRLPQQSTSVVDESGPESSGPSRLFDSYPNPFNASTTLGFELDRRQPVSLRVHNLTGQRVKTLAEGVHPEGFFAVSWDGRDDRGREVASGVYLVRLRLEEQTLSHSLTLVR